MRRINELFKAITAISIMTLVIAITETLGFNNIFKFMIG